MWLFGQNDLKDLYLFRLEKESLSQMTVTWIAHFQSTVFTFIVWHQFTFTMVQRLLMTLIYACATTMNFPNLGKCQVLSCIDEKSVDRHPVVKSLQCQVSWHLKIYIYRKYIIKASPEIDYSFFFMFYFYIYLYFILQCSFSQYFRSLFKNRWHLALQ